MFEGSVIGISEEFVTVDIGYKQEGLIFTREFRNFDGTLKVKEGDKIEVYLEKLESSLGNLVLSRDNIMFFLELIKRNDSKQYLKEE